MLMEMSNELKSERDRLLLRMEGGQGEGGMQGMGQVGVRTAREGGGREEGEHAHMHMHTMHMLKLTQHTQNTHTQICTYSLHTLFSHHHHGNTTPVHLCPTKFRRATTSLWQNSSCAACLFFPQVDDDGQFGYSPSSLPASFPHQHYAHPGGRLQQAPATAAGSSSPPPAPYAVPIYLYPSAVITAPPQGGGQEQGQGPGGPGEGRGGQDQGQRPGGSGEGRAVQEQGQGPGGLGVGNGWGAHRRKGLRGWGGRPR